MKKRIALISIILAVIIGIVVPSVIFFQNKNITDEAILDTNEPDETSTESEEITDQEDKSSQFITLTGKFTDREIVNEESAILAVKDVAPSLGLKNATEDLTPKSTNTVENITYYRLQQNYEGIPVYGSTFVVIADKNGEAQGLTGNATDINTDISLTPTVTQDQVAAIIRAYVGENVEISIPELSENMLVVYNYNDLETSTLAYRLYLTHSDNWYEIILNAQNCDILEMNSLIYTSEAAEGTGKDIEDNEHKFNVVLEDGKYKLFDYKRLIQIHKAKTNKYNEGDICQSSTNVWNDSKAVTAMVRTAAVYDFYSEIFGKIGHNGDAPLFVYYDATFKGNTVAQSGALKILNFNEFDSYISFSANHLTLQTVGHEYTHSIERNVSGMKYSGESGAIMEGYSDIFGELFEDWYYDRSLGGESTCNWIANRSIKSPSDTKNPSKYLNDQYWDRNQEVHRNSTVISHLAYQMAIGTDTISPLDLNQLAKLWYHTLYTLPSNCTFSALRTNMEMIAENLNFSNEEISCVQYAFENALIPKGNAEQIYAKDFEIVVYDYNGKIYDDYTIEVSGTQNKWFGKKEEYGPDSTVVESPNAIKATLPEGTFTITITDNKDSTKIYSQKITVKSSGTINGMVFGTDFGSKHVHTYTTTSQVPTCTVSGWIKEVCSCGDVKNQETIPTIAHLFVAGKCSVCGTNEDVKDTDFSEGLSFTSNGDGTCYVSGIGTCTDADIVIPSTYMGEAVTSIGHFALSGCSNITSITIPNSVTYIGHNAFMSCINLTSITIPNSVTIIDKFAFYCCYSLTSIIIPDSVTSIGADAFEDCTNLTSITFPNNVTSIGDCVFTGCLSLTSITVADGNTKYHSSGNCLIETASKTLISGCKNSVIPVDGSVTSIGSWAFENCIGLTSISIPDSVTSIGKYAFSGCSNLQTVYYTGSEYDWNAINIEEGNNALISATIVYSKSDDSNNKTESAGLKFELNSDNQSYSMVGIGTCTDTDIVIPSTYMSKKVTSIGNYALQNCTNLTSITIPDSITSIGSYAFYQCSSLTSITIPNGVTSIGGCTFYGCSSLTSITIPNSVTSIGSWAFTECSSLTSVTIGNSVKTIAAYAFSFCSSLTSIIIPDSVTSISDYAFVRCSNLTSITLPFVGATKDGTYGNFGYIFGALYFSDNARYVPTSLKTVVITGGTEIYAYAFSGCSYITNITIPDSVTSIGSYAFEGCTSLASVTIGNSVKTIDNGVFLYCSSLTNITIPNSVTSIGISAFEGCSSLKSITIPNSVTSIESWAFSGCSSLKKVVLGNCVEEIGYSAFTLCTSLTSITIPDSVTYIGSYAFEDCSSLTSVTFENPNGWWYSSDADATSGTSISSASLSNTSTAAKYLTSTYYNKYWKRG